MDFYRIVENASKKDTVEIYPDFLVRRSKDIMIRGGEFYAVWDNEAGKWTTDEYDVQKIVDRDIKRVAKEASERYNATIVAKYMQNYSSGSWLKFMGFVSKIPENYQQLDRVLQFSNSEVNKELYSSKSLPYPLKSGDISAYDELMSVLYDPEEREKLEWAIGAIISGDSKRIEKFIVLYGQSGAGKSTFLNILQQLFEGYYTVFEAKALVGQNNAFATEAFRSNPLVAIQHDGDLSRIEDNTKLNSIVSHEYMVINEKHKSTYKSKLDAFLFMGTNTPVKITDAKSGIIRRLIDVKPTGNKVPYDKYQELMGKISFELGAIADYCLYIYQQRGPDYYEDYIPEEMILKTDYFYNFVDNYQELFESQDGITLSHAFKLYKEYCQEAQLQYSMNRVSFREELKNYFDNFDERIMIGNERVRSWYSGFKSKKFRSPEPRRPRGETPVFEGDILDVLDLHHRRSVLDDILSSSPAQLATKNETPSQKWADVTTTLSDIDTSQIHYVRVPVNHIVIDFDLKDANGDKSQEANILAASKWPETYAEFSKGGAGIHLHYIYDGDPLELANLYSDGVEVKVFKGGSSLRRRLSLCNDRPVAHISSGLPLKEKKVINEEFVRSEKSIRELIERNLRKEIHPGTKPSMDFIKKILDDAYESGVSYDVSNMYTDVMAFAANSTNQALYCMKLLDQIKWASDNNNDIEASVEPTTDDVVPYFFDVEVFPNRFILCYKRLGNEQTVRMIDPTPSEVETVLRLPLVGFNNRKYDNHILYGRMMGMDNEELYRLSQRIINNEKNAAFPAAYGVSYTDIYDYASKKQSLKKWQVELGIHHKELGMDWEQPLPDDRLEEAIEYCANDVISTEAVFEATAPDFKARQILAAISGLTVNDKTQKHTSRILFHGDKNHKELFKYHDLREDFPGYSYSFGKSIYKGREVGEGGYVYAEPGSYRNVALLDVASMHPTSAINMEIFGPYTKNYKDLLEARLAIKHGDFEKAGKMLDGKLAPYLDNKDQAKELSYALKIVINIVYGLTSAKFENDFNDIRNVDNIVAKRGALFMVDLLEAVQAKGYQVVHIKTDSIKIAEADDEIIKFVTEFGDKYGYTFEHEATYERMCLVNDAVYIAYYDGHWSATGAQFKHPYVFKTLFSKEPVDFDDLVETKEVRTALYLDMVENLEPGQESNMVFVGRVGSFVPVLPGNGGGHLYRVKDDKYYAASNTKGYLWMEAEVARTLGMNDFIDMRYFDRLTGDARAQIEKYDNFEEFVCVPTGA